MSSRNHYLTKLNFADSCPKFVVSGIDVKFIAGKKDRDRGNINSRSHVVYDYRNIFENAEKREVRIYALLHAKHLQYTLQTMYTNARPVKIDKISLKELKEIYDANVLMFSNISNELVERRILTDLGCDNVQNARI